MHAHPAVLLQTLSNLGDALVAQGEAALQAGQPDAGQAAFASALEAYQASCALSDSSAGDDLPGLLHNWGVGLHTISKQAQVCSVAVAASPRRRIVCWARRL
jgi:hypothetical protein